MLVTFRILRQTPHPAEWSSGPDTVWQPARPVGLLDAEGG